MYTYNKVNRQSLGEKYWLCDVQPTLFQGNNNIDYVDIQKYAQSIYRIGITPSTMIIQIEGDLLIYKYNTCLILSIANKQQTDENQSPTKVPFFFNSDYISNYLGVQMFIAHNLENKLSASMERQVFRGSSSNSW